MRKRVAPAVPGADGLAGHVVQHPALARLHAGLVDAVAEHVVVVAHDDAPCGRCLHDGIAHCALVAFDVELDAGVELLLGAVERWPSRRLWATVRKVRPSVSKWAVVGVFAWAAAFVAALFSFERSVASRRYRAECARRFRQPSRSVFVP